MIRIGQAIGTGRTATVTVAASNSQQASGKQAEYRCDGENDQEVIQEAIDSLGLEGGKVLLMEGVYNVAAPILIPSNTTFEGLGRNTKIKAGTNFAGATADRAGHKRVLEATGTSVAPLTNIIIKNIAVDGNQPNQAGWVMPVGIQWVNNFLINNCFIHNTSYTATEIWNCNDGIFTNNIVKNVIVGDGLGVDKSKYIAVVNNHFENVLEGVVFAGTTYCIFSNNSVRGVDTRETAGFHIEGSTHCAIQNNVLLGFPTAVVPPTTKIGLWIRHRAGNPPTAFCSFIGNHILRFPVGMEIDGTTHDCIIADNYLRGNHARTQGDFSQHIKYTSNNPGFPEIENSGTATFSGTGTFKNFDFPHGLTGRPKTVLLFAKSADAAGDKFYSATSTHIIVTFLTAPPAGTNNVVLNWQAVW